MDKYITVLTATYTPELAVIRSRLESEGITCSTKDELTVQVQPFISNAIGGVKLQVKESDLNQTVEILKEAGYTNDSDFLPFDESSRLNHDSGERQNTNGKVKLCCSNCGSEEVVKSKKAGWIFLVTSLFTSLFCYAFTPFFQKTYYCFDCRKEFKSS